MTKDFHKRGEISNTIVDYMTLRIKGAGRGLSDEEIQYLRGLPETTWDAIAIAIVELGGSLPEGLNVPTNPSAETMSLSRVLRGTWQRGDEKRVRQVGRLLRKEFGKHNVKRVGGRSGSKPIVGGLGNRGNIGSAISRHYQ